MEVNLGRIEEFEGRWRSGFVQVMAGLNMKMFEQDRGQNFDNVTLRSRPQNFKSIQNRCLIIIKEESRTRSRSPGVSNFDEHRRLTERRLRFRAGASGRTAFLKTWCLVL